MKEHSEFMTSEHLRELGLIGAPQGAGSHFKSFLQRKKLTATQVANNLNVNESIITEFINGDTELSIDLAILLKRVYDAPVALLFIIEAQYKEYLVLQSLSAEIN
jgi:plasmid maintenance system antidote protein VapI